MKIGDLTTDASGATRPVVHEDDGDGWVGLQVPGEIFRWRRATELKEPTEEERKRYEDKHVRSSS